MRRGFRRHLNQSILHHLDRLGTDQRYRTCRHRQYQSYLDLCLLRILVRWLNHRHLDLRFHLHH